MQQYIIGLFLSLFIILLSCELFTNGIEWLGIKLGVGDGVVGSIFSAVGTCLPETMIPVIAILFPGNKIFAEDIGVGAIIGAPFMLSTLAFFITGLSVIIFEKKRRIGYKMLIDKGILSRDLGFFMLAYSIGTLAAFIKSGLIKDAVAIFLVILYIVYLVRIVKYDTKNLSQPELLYLSNIFKFKSCISLILMQIIFALAGIFIGARIFVTGIERISQVCEIPALVLALVITPIATELPEKFNSIIWIRKRKDTLALGNITGAMVFQSCLPVAIGIIATPWELSSIALVCVVHALTSAFFTYIWLKCESKLITIPLVTGGFLYLLYILYIAYLTLHL